MFQRRQSTTEKMISQNGTPIFMRYEFLPCTKVVYIGAKKNAYRGKSYVSWGKSYVSRGNCNVTKNISYLGANVMYLGAMWRWGRVGDILADVLSYRSCLTRERGREREGDSCHTEILNSNQINLTNHSKPNKVNQTGGYQSPTVWDLICPERHQPRPN